MIVLFESIATVNLKLGVILERKGDAKTLGAPIDVKATIYSPVYEYIEMLKQDQCTVRIATQFNVGEWQININDPNGLNVVLDYALDREALLVIKTTDTVDASITVYDASNNRTIAVLHVKTVPTPLNL